MIPRPFRGRVPPWVLEASHLHRFALPIGIGNNTTAVAMPEVDLTGVEGLTNDREHRELAGYGP